MTFNIMQQYFKPDINFKSCPVSDGDELFPNGIFVFNISKMLAYIKDNKDHFIPEEVGVNEINSSYSHINEEHVESVDVSNPVILAEISPGRYNLIDGHHRVKKACLLHMETIKAYRLKAFQHIQFLTSLESYEKYIDYWNDKMKDQIS